MAARIELLGSPRVTTAGEPRVPRGRKPWALLAYLLCSNGPASRKQLADLLFVDAGDPLGALRWNLAELRRLLGPEHLVADDRVSVRVPPATFVDVRVLHRGTWTEAVALPTLGRDLLEGMEFGACPGFDAWLSQERRHLQGVTEAVLHEAAVFRLARGETAEAIAAATRLVALNPYDENFHELLIRSYARAGDEQGARRRLQACVELFRRELDREPGAAVSQAAADRPAPTPSPGRGTASVRAQLDAGESAISAGAVDRGLESLRRAVAWAEGTGDAPLAGRALLALGRALVHSVRGGDEEAAAALRRAVLVAGARGDGAVVAAAYGELGYIEVLRGRNDRAFRLLDRALEHADDHPREAAAVETTMGMALSDMGRYRQAARRLRSAAAHAERTGDQRRLSYALSMIGRIHLLVDDLPAARKALERSLALARTDGWLGFLPWPEALLAEVDLADGDLAAAGEGFEHAFALGCELGDPCWEGISRRGLGLVLASQNPAEGLLLLEDSCRRAMRAADGYLWVVAYALDALCAVALDARDARALGWIDDLRSLAARTAMREFVVRSYLHETRLGNAGALEAARAVATEVESPALRRLCERTPAVA